MEISNELLERTNELLERRDKLQEELKATDKEILRISLSDSINQLNNKWLMESHMGNCRILHFSASDTAIYMEKWHETYTMRGDGCVSYMQRTKLSPEDIDKISKDDNLSEISEDEAIEYIRKMMEYISSKCPTYSAKDSSTNSES